MNPNDDHRTELIRGLTSAALLAGLLIAIPILLIFGVGWPLPQEIPSGSKITTAIKTGAIPPSLVSKSVAIMLWILWLQSLAGVVIELWAHFHGRVAPRVTVIPQFVQSLSARMISTALLIAFSIQQPGVATADNQELLTPTTIELDFDREFTPTQPLIHKVQQKESLRTLAERYLGDPNRWTEVFVLNQGQPQAVGESLTDPTRLQPGWELVMPADAHLPTSVELTPDTTTETNHQVDLPSFESDSTKITVQPGDTLWDLAAHHLDDPERWVDIFGSNRDIVQDPNVIVPGWELRLPADDSVDNSVDDTPLFIEPPVEPLFFEPPVESSVELEDHAVPVLAFNTARPTVTASVNPPSINSPSEDQQGVSTTQTMFAVGGLGVFASSLGWMLARLRRIQRRRLPTDRLPATPTREAVHLEYQLQAASDPDNALFLDASLRVMSSRFTGGEPPEVVGVTLDSDTVSVLLDTPTDPPFGFNASQDNTTWTLSTSEVLEHLLIEAEGVPAPLPTLVAIGKKSGTEFLLNLEHMTSLSLSGKPEAINSLCSALAIQLASSHFADDLTVICVGFGQDLGVFERVVHVPDVTAAIDRVAHQQRQNRALFGNGSFSADTRIGNSGDYWHPVVALVPGRLTEEEAHRLLEVCGSSVCVVGHELRGATWSGRFDEFGLLLEAIDLRLEPHGLSGVAVAAVAELATIAKDTQGVQREMSSVTQSADLEISAPSFKPLSTEVEVRVIGTVDVQGAAQPFTSRRALDLVAYLAFHPEGADRDQLRAHLWPPDDPPSESTLANTVSRARKALGVDDDGNPYLPRVTTKGIYRLRPEVGTDVARFEALVSAASRDDGEQGRRHLQSALELVRGTPFTGGTGDMYRWADFGLRTQIDCMVDTAAHELAKRCLEAGDPEGTRRAVMTSLRLVGVCEECYRWRLMAAAENPTEIRQIMAELLGLLKRENGQPEGDDLISPDLLELYEKLMSSRPLFS